LAKRVDYAVGCGRATNVGGRGPRSLGDLSRLSRFRPLIAQCPETVTLEPADETDRRSHPCGDLPVSELLTTDAEPPVDHPPLHRRELGQQPANTGCLQVCRYPLLYIRLGVCAVHHLRIVQMRNDAGDALDVLQG
jgi:hypothetical protein